MPYIFDCNSCDTKCDGKSKGVYKFMDDVQYSEHFENLIIDEIKERGFYAVKTEREQYPDIEVYDNEKNHNLLCFIEVKAQRRTFMSVEHCLPDANLVPSETVVLNQSDLEHYISQSRVETVPIYVAWVLSNRPCIVDDGKIKIFYNNINELKRIFINYGDRRRFRRRSGQGDIVNGQHMGVVVNYHFSLNELLLFNLDDILG